MTKIEFLMSLHDKLAGLPQKDVEEHLSFYSEMIEDRIEEGSAEEEAVSAIGSVEEIAEQIMAEIPLTKLVKEKIRPKRRLSIWEIILLVLGSPVWFSLLIAAFAVLVSLYVVLWSVIIALWAVFISLAVCSGGGVVSCIVFALGGNVTSGAAMLAGGFVCAGLAIFLYYGCVAATKGMGQFTMAILRGIKRCFVKREGAQ